MASRPRHRPKFYASLLAFGIVLAVFLYIVLLLLLPFIIGPWAILAAIVIAVPLLYHVLRARRGPRRKPLYRPLPQRTPSGPRRTDYLEELVAAMFIVTVFVVGIIALGNYISAASPEDATGAVLAATGFALANTGIWILIGLYDEARWPMNIEYFSTVDTTEDH